MSICPDLLEVRPAAWAPTRAGRQWRRSDCWPTCSAIVPQFLLGKLGQQLELLWSGQAAGLRAAQPAGRPATYRSCRVATLFAASMAYQGSPLAATVIPNGPLPLTALPSVMTPALVMRAALPLVSWVNHTVPSGAAAMPEGPGLLGVRKMVATPVDGSRRPTAWGVNRAVNQTCPSEATVMLRGATVVEPSLVGVVVTAPVAASIRPRLLVPGALTSPGWVNQALPATSTATSAGSTTGDEVNCPFARW